LNITLRLLQYIPQLQVNAKALEIHRYNTLILHEQNKCIYKYSSNVLL